MNYFKVSNKKFCKQNWLSLSLFFSLAMPIWAQNTAKDVEEKYLSIRGDWPMEIDVALENLPENALLVDVRSDEEWEVSRIPGALTLEEYQKKLDSQTLTKDSTVYFYCTIGYRSGKAAEEWREKGFKSYNLVGGVLNWAHAGHHFVIDPLKKDSTKRVHVYGKSWNYLPSGYEAIY